MFRKLNNKTLAIVFTGLLAVVALIYFLDSGGNDYEMRTDFPAIDSAAVTAMIINAAANNNQEMKITKEERWRVSMQNRAANAEPNLVNNMINELMGLKPLRLAARSKEKWAAYQVDDSLGTRIRIMSGEKVMLDMMLGKFDYNQQSRQTTTYVRLREEEEVYAVNGMPGFTFNREYDQFTDKVVIKGSYDEFNRLEYGYPGDSSYVLERSGTGWVIDGTPVDSAIAEAHVRSLTNLHGTEPVEGLDLSGKTAAYTLTVSRAGTPIEVRAWEHDTTWIVTSSLNPGAMFNGAAGKMAEKVFRARGYFLGNR